MKQILLYSHKNVFIVFCYWHRYLFTLDLFLIKKIEKPSQIHVQIDKIYLKRWKGYSLIEQIASINGNFTC